jgi:hypothetical protein
MPTFKRQPIKNADRLFFGNTRSAIPTPDLIEIQKNSYDWFVKFGIKELFDEVSPITDFSGRDLELYLENYYLDEKSSDTFIYGLVSPDGNEYAVYGRMPGTDPATLVATDIWCVDNNGAGGNPTVDATTQFTTAVSACW